MTNPAEILPSIQDRIENVVVARARLDTEDRVSNARKDARNEAMLRREYHGRFLIELLQNARDAWILSGGALAEGLLRVRVSRDNCLLVGNTGEAITDRVLLFSLCKTGESTKPPGVGIGQKGIGFKSVLEVSDRPEVHSRSGEGPFDLRVKFDRQAALALVTEHSPRWDEISSSLPSAPAHVDESRDHRFPLFDLPTWCEVPAVAVHEFGQVGDRSLNTVISLPYTPGRLDEVAWVARVRAALADLSDEVFVLLGAFKEAHLEDEFADAPAVVVTARTVTERTGDGVDVREVDVLRDGAPSSTWWVYGGEVPGTTRLDGKVTVAVRMRDQGGVLVPVLPGQRARGGPPLHLFFPTHIPSGLPFLLHAYFEVDAGRKTLAEDEPEHNAARLDALEKLVAAAVDDLCCAAQKGLVDLTGLPDLFASTAAEIENAQVREFRERVLARLDAVPWVRFADQEGTGHAPPIRVLAIADADLASEHARAFPAPYLARRVRLTYPSDGVGPTGRAWLASRPGAPRPMACLETLLRPGEQTLWANPDDGFRALLDLLKRLEANHKAEVGPMLDRLAGDPAVRILPVVSDTGSGIELLPPCRRRDSDDADAEEEAIGPERAVFARLRMQTGQPLVPPAVLGLAFLRDRAVDEGQIKGIAARLGVRDYITRDILEHISRGRTDGWSDQDRTECAQFMWRLLLRERASEYAISGDALSAFTPGAFAWYKAGRASSSRFDERRAQALSRRLAQLSLPTRAGGWRPAEELAFGADWAEFFAGPAASVGASEKRAAAYRDLEALAPDPSSLVASPEHMRATLPLIEGDAGWTAELPEMETLDLPTRHGVLVFLFLQRLGVWEIPPVVFHASYRDEPPSVEAKQPEGWWAVAQTSPGPFTEYKHANLRIGENFRWRWPLQPGSSAQLQAIARGASYYGTLGHLALFCNKCKWHQSTRYTNQGSDTPSTLLWTLRQEPWIPVTVDGEAVPPVPPASAWWEPEAHANPAFRQSKYRFLPLADKAVNEGLARALGCPGKLGATVAQVSEALRLLRERYEQGALWRTESDRPNARQAFVASHVRLYELLIAHPPERVSAVLAEIGVLADNGAQLVWVKPTDARHDDGSFASYRRHFLGQIPFLVVPRRETGLANALGVPRFSVTLSRVPIEGEQSEAPTPPRWLADAMPELLAILLFVPVSGQPLTVGSTQFSTRARRLAALRISWVSDLVQQVSVVGRPDLSRKVGEATAGEVFLDGATTTQPVLFHDHDRATAEDQLRLQWGAVVATILESAAHADSLTLYFQQRGEANRSAFLAERSIGVEEISLVRDELQRTGLLERLEERRWWQALLPMLGVADPLPTADGLHAFLRAALERSALTLGARERLLRAGGGADVRGDRSGSGVLATLEAEGLDLQQLDQALRALGDDGLDLRAARDLLHTWRADHGHEVATLLFLRGRPSEQAKAAPNTWKVPPALLFCTDPALTDVLHDVVVDLRTSGLEIDPAQLSGPGVREFLAGLADRSVEGLRAATKSLYVPEEAAERTRSLVQRCRSVLVPLLVALRTRPDDPGFRIREEGRLVEQQLPSTGAILDLVEPTRGLLSEAPTVADALTCALGTADREQVLPAGLVAGLPPDSLDPNHRTRVARELDGARRTRTRELQNARETLRAGGIAPVAPAGLQAPPPRAPRPAGPKNVPLGAVRRDARRLDALGQAGERWALAALLDPILTLPSDQRRAVIYALMEALRAAYEGVAVQRKEGQATAALDTVEDDEEFAMALHELLHLSPTSDHFGCDAFAWLSPAPGAEPRPLFVEVKSDSDRAFPVSVNEWKEAERLGAAYAFLVILRGAQPNDAPRAMELLVDPHQLAGAQLTVEPDGHLVRYHLQQEST